jgi:3-hydroxyisobutyrate dehydrogenase-like beta-hydroxyacid dehydrogenase
MNIGLIGLGKMGQAIAYRLTKEKHNIQAFDLNVKKIAMKRVQIVKTIQTIAKNNDIIWLMVPAGKTVDQVL